jgi:hypothetical protein
MIFDLLALCLLIASLLYVFAHFRQIMAGEGGPIAQTIYRWLDIWGFRGLVITTLVFTGLTILLYGLNKLVKPMDMSLIFMGLGMLWGMLITWMAFDKKEQARIEEAHDPQEKIPV